MLNVNDSKKKDGKSVLEISITGHDIINLKKCCSADKKKFNLNFVYFDYGYSETESAFVSTNGHVLCLIPFEKLEHLREYDKKFFDFKRLKINKGNMKKYLFIFDGNFVMIQDLEADTTTVEILKAWDLGLEYPEYKRVFPEEKEHKGVSDTRIHAKYLPSSGSGVRLKFGVDNLSPILVEVSAAKYMIYIVMPMRV